jgi:hypothetical protein
MKRVLDTVDWSVPALSLLGSVKKLDPMKPAVMFIRHTERFATSERESAGATVSTSRGMSAAIEFGEALPQTRRYRVYHSNMARAKETAEGIRYGVASKGGLALVSGIIPATLAVDVEAADTYVQGLQKRYGGAPWLRRFIYAWCAGLIPPGIVNPSIDFTRLIAEYTASNIRSARLDTLDIYVSQDTWIAALLLHWFGEPVNEDGIRYLEGFMMQSREKDLTLYLGGRKVLAEYPYWWGQI